MKSKYALVRTLGIRIYTKFDWVQHEIKHFTDFEVHGTETGDMQTLSRARATQQNKRAKCVM